MISNPYACTRCLNLRRPDHIYSFRQTTSYYLVIILRIVIIILITSNPNTANMMNNTLQFSPLINGLCVCTKTLQSGRCDFPGEAIAGQIFPGLWNEWNSEVHAPKMKLSCAADIKGINYHFSAFRCVFLTLLIIVILKILVKYLQNTCEIPVQLRNFICITWFALHPLRTLSAPLATQNQ